MPATIGGDEVAASSRSEMPRVVEVLPRAEYEWAHLPDAMRLPLKEFSAEAATTKLTRERPVVVYCHDYQ